MISTLGTVSTRQPATSLAWSADGELLAFRDGDSLVVVARDGTARRTSLVGTAAAFQRDTEENDLLVATVRTGSAAIERLETVAMTRSRGSIVDRWIGRIARRSRTSHAGHPTAHGSCSGSTKWTTRLSRPGPRSRWSQ